MNPDPAHLAAELANLRAGLAQANAAAAAIDALLAPAEPPPRGMLTTAELAELFDLSPGQIARLCRDGKEFGIPGIEKVGKPWRATREAMDEVWSRKGRR